MDGAMNADKEGFLILDGEPVEECKCHYIGGLCTYDNPDCPKCHPFGKWKYDKEPEKIEEFLEIKHSDGGVDAKVAKINEIIRALNQIRR